METLTINETLVQIPAKYLKEDFAWKIKPSVVTEVKDGYAIFYSVTKRGSILKVPVIELLPVNLPYFNFHKEEAHKRCIIVDSVLISGVKLYTAAFYALKSIGKYSDGGCISCYFTDDSLTKVKVKGYNGSKTFTIEELNKY